MKRNAAGPRRRILIVDGYNVINVRKPVRESLQLEDARRRLTDRLHDYAGYSGQQIILVYDAWLSNRMQRSVERHGALEVVFTMKGETADCYIERLCDELAEDIALRRGGARGDLGWRGADRGAGQGRGARVVPGAASGDGHGPAGTRRAREQQRYAQAHGGRPPVSGRASKA